MMTLFETLHFEMKIIIFPVFKEVTILSKNAACEIFQASFKYKCGCLG